MWAAVALTCVAAFRAQLTFWLGRGLLRGLQTSPRVKARFESEGMARGRRAVERWGWPIIPLSFLTIGFQTAVQAGAGLLGWSWARYTLAALPGYVLWGCAYAAGGLAAFAGVIALAGVSSWLAAGVGAAAAAAGAAAVALGRRRRKGPTPSGDPV